MYTGYTKCGGKSGEKARANGKKKSERKKLRLLASTRFAQTLRHGCKSTSGFNGALTIAMRNTVTHIITR